MGWWSATIMGGDIPADLEWSLRDLLGVKDEDRISHRDFKGNLARICEWLDSHSWECERYIAHHVVAYHVLATNANVTRKFLNRLIEHAKEAPGEEWGDEERDQCLKDLRDSLKRHGSTGAVELKREYLGAMGR